MLRYQVGRRVSWQEHAIRKHDLWKEQHGKCKTCGRSFPSSDSGVRHHPQMVSDSGVDLPGIANECWICKDCHERIHPWLSRMI